MLDWINIKDRNINKQKIIRMQEDSKVEKASHRSADSQKTPAFGPENSQEETLYNCNSGGELSEAGARVPGSHHFGDSDPASEGTRAQLAYVNTVKKSKAFVKIRELNKDATNEENIEILHANQKALAKALATSQEDLKKTLTDKFEEKLQEKFEELYRLLSSLQVSFGHLLNQIVPPPSVLGNRPTGNNYCYVKSQKTQKNLWKSRKSRSERSHLQRQS
eukprot:TRINITY_DN15907_c0_g2_i1.p1 TRINITY_DN15907_c0_g2~~TRINITY_DN15907_c0_g2_i1.p1  ORF type:complete len:220 (-),score=7.35 TRINITY_DN15907_c0_g2_i1:126-785(-)